MRDCHTRLAQTFRQHRASNLDETGIQVEAPPSFYIEPPVLTDDNLLLDPKYTITQDQNAPDSQTDSGYGSGNISFMPDRREMAGDGNLQEDHGSFYDGNDNDIGISHLDQTTLENYDWAAMLGDVCYEPIGPST